MDPILELENKLSNPKLSKQWRKIYQQELDNLLFKEEYDHYLLERIDKKDETV